MADMGFQIEVEPIRVGGVRGEGVEDRIITATDEKLKTISVAIGNCAKFFAAEISSFTARPNELSIEFGIDARGEAGIPLVTKGSLGANFKVSMKWSSD